MDRSNTESTSHGLWNWEVVRWVVTLSLLLFALVFLYDGITEESNRIDIRLSARISVVLFCLAFVASGLQRLTKNVFTFWLRMNRKYLGISFAIVHLIHLGFLVLLQLAFHPVFTKAPLISLLGGGLAYVFVVLVLLTSFP